MKNTNNGFVIAEEDLKIRGIGDVMGLQQSGIKDYRIADLSRDFQLLEEANKRANYIIQNHLENNYINLLYLFGYANYLNGGYLN